MKKQIKSLVLISFLAGMVSRTVLGQFTIDEFGVQGNNGVNLPSILAPDPSGAIAGNVLIYLLPFGVTPGDVLLTEPGQPAPAFSDVLRFWNPAGNPNQSELIFYSDFSSADPADAPADVGLPAQLQVNTININEVGPEGNNGALYAANPGMPGADFSGVPTQYNIISDAAVPEPGTAALLVGGLGLLAGIKRYRQK